MFRPGGGAQGAAGGDGAAVFFFGERREPRNVGEALAGALAPAVTGVAPVAAGAAADPFDPGAGWDDGDDSIIGQWFLLPPMQGA